ncbi:hypothetical protein VSAK1_26305 [Vibrio mediterranei AK1]|uniref:hypothetical protein n=1 Tax=Vibrio mediterranei TaxID=689 RepID=UPI000154121A|nr:hypothetical protein [Vibrio mediterranei]EDL53755.1 hypothetical protein VSAK1_26305 [Vibrio mediterranei AK1]
MDRRLLTRLVDVALNGASAPAIAAMKALEEHDVELVTELIDEVTGTKEDGTPIEPEPVAKVNDSTVVTAKDKIAEAKAKAAAKAKAKGDD